MFFYTQEQIEEFKKNSDRYMWLRKSGRSKDLVGPIIDKTSEGHGHNLESEVLDNAIDREMDLDSPLEGVPIWPSIVVK